MVAGSTQDRQSGDAMAGHVRLERRTLRQGGPSVCMRTLAGSHEMRAGAGVPQLQITDTQPRASVATRAREHWPGVWGESGCECRGRGTVRGMGEGAGAFGGGRTHYAMTTIWCAAQYATVGRWWFQQWSSI